MLTEVQVKDMDPAYSDETALLKTHGGRADQGEYPMIYILYRAVYCFTDFCSKQSKSHGILVMSYSLLWSLLATSIEMEFLVSDESPYFSHYACEILRATDVACKSYKAKT